MNAAAQARRLRIAALLAAIVGLLCIAAGARQFLFVETGPRTTATVQTCSWDRSGRTGYTDCRGTWTEPNRGGRLVTGMVAGAQPGDEGKTFAVTLHGDTAYTNDVFSPAVLLVFGVAAGGFAPLFLRMAGRKQRPR